MAIGEDEAALGIDDESRRLRGRIPLRIKRARGIDFNGHDGACDALERDGPVGAFLDCGGLLRELRRLLALPLAGG